MIAISFNKIKLRSNILGGLYNLTFTCAAIIENTTYEEYLLLLYFFLLSIYLCII